MKYAIIQSGGKQYRCSEGDFLEVDRFDAETGVTHTIDQVLLLADGESVKVGKPTVDGAKVTATVMGEVKGEHTMAFRYKAKERQRRRRGHRQSYTRLKIETIVG